MFFFLIFMLNIKIKLVFDKKYIALKSLSYPVYRKGVINWLQYIQQLLQTIRTKHREMFYFCNYC